MAWLLVAVAHGALVSEAPPVAGVETVLSVTDGDGDPDSGETVRVVHRSGLAGSREIAIGITDGRGRVRWTPALAGVARVRAGDQILDTSVAAASVPQTTALLLAALLATGLAALGVGVAWRST